jgi:2,3-bisphosphoglycerate-independent phosphoglycerate mutase
MNQNKKFLLMILDGWGVGDGSKSDVIRTTGAPYIESLKSKYPNSQLLACGENVGLPDGQMGNSEVGHLNIGAGRIIYQDLVRINIAVRDNSLSQNPELVSALQYAKDNDKQLHFLGLLSDGGVHSSAHHLYKLCEIADEFGLDKVFVHALMDGRDTDPKSGAGYMLELENKIANLSAKVASVCGRYYTMDRDKRWERVKKGYDLLVSGIGEKAQNPIDAINDSYANDVTDEFILPTAICDANGSPIATIQEGDVVLCFNFRTDRLREITTVLTQKDMPELEMKTLKLRYLTMTNYDDTFVGVTPLFDKDNVQDTLGETISKAGLTQLRIAETEKYAHVTFFFSGGREAAFPGEERVLINSPKVATYDLQPEMSAFLVKDALLAELNKQKHNFICLNFANGDMVGHTGIYPAIQKAVKTVDQCVKEVVETALANGYEAMIIADHGNADYAVNPDGSPNTAHSLNPVPCILISDRFASVNNGVLADVAPTILKAMGLDIPKDMSGKALI